MIIGVAAVIAMVALGTGAQAMIEDQVKTAGHEPHHRSWRAARTPAASATAPAGNIALLPEDAQPLRDLPEIQYVAESVGTRLQVIYGSQNWNTSVEGTNVDLPIIRVLAAQIRIVLHRGGRQGRGQGRRPRFERVEHALW